MPEFAPEAVHDATGVGPVVVFVQVVVTKLLPELAVAAVQLETSVGPVVTVSQ